MSAIECQTDYSLEQLKDPELKELILYLREDVLPDCPERARKLVAKASQFSLINGVLMYLDHNHGDRRRVAIPPHHREKVLCESHGGAYGGHFAGPKLIVQTLVVERYVQ